MLSKLTGLRPLRYAVFACVAILTNILTQRLVLLIYAGIYSIYIAMFFGTLTGLIVKFLLDRAFIFYYRPKNRVDSFFRFFLYSCMGILTTFIFWSVELLFDFLFPFDHAKYIGAAVGLTAGYTAKYFLDKRFVFRK